MESIKDVLNTGNISFRYVEPKQEAKTDLSGIIQEQMKRNTERMSRIKEAYQNGVILWKNTKQIKRCCKKEMELLRRSSRNPLIMKLIIRKIMKTAFWKEFVMYMKS